MRGEEGEAVRAEEGERGGGIGERGRRESWHEGKTHMKAEQ